jgi:hypothetical protein
VNNTTGVSSCLLTYKSDVECYSIKLKTYAVREISGSHGGEYEYGCLLGCRTVYSGINSLTFQVCLLRLSPGHKVPLKRRSICTRLHGAKSHKTTILILTVYCQHQAQITKAGGTSETSVNFYQTTRRNITEDKSSLHAVHSQMNMKLATSVNQSSDELHT